MSSPAPAPATEALRRMLAVRAGVQWLHIDEATASLCASRLDLNGFAGNAPPGSGITVERVSALERAIPLDPQGREPGVFAIEGERLLVVFPDRPRSAEAALRAAFQLAAIRQGGFILHASGVLFGDAAVVFVGPSGAGKSTIARICRDAGARVLSDESIMILPSGAYGTPFRSEPDLPGDLSAGVLMALCSLKHGRRETLVPVSPSEGAALVLSQGYRRPSSEISSAEMLRRIDDVSTTAGVWELTFRKGPIVAGFLQDWLSRRKEAHAPHS